MQDVQRTLGFSITTCPSINAKSRSHHKIEKKTEGPLESESLKFVYPRMFSMAFSGH